MVSTMDTEPFLPEVHEQGGDCEGGRLAALLDRRAWVRSDGCVAGGDAAGRLAWLSRVREPIVAERPGSCGVRDGGRWQRAMVLVMDMLPRRRMWHRLCVRSLRLVHGRGFLLPLVVATFVRGARHRMAAGAACSAALAFWAVTGAASETGGGEAAPQHDGYVEEVIVTADRLEKGARPTQTIIVQTYSVLRRGKRLYNERRYKEALPLSPDCGQTRLQVGTGDGGRHLPPRSWRRRSRH